MRIKASALIKMLEQAIDKFGDLPVLGGNITDERPPSKVIALDDDGGDAESSGEKPVGLYLEA